MPTTEVPQETAIQRESVSPQTVVPTTPPPKAKKDPKKKKIRRFGASSNNRNGLPGTKKEDLSVGINEKVEEPLLYSSPPVERVAYNKDGTLDLTANRIDFMKDDWYQQFQYYRELLAGQKRMDSSSLQKWWEECKGESDGQFTVNYAIVANACLNPPDNNVILYGDGGKEVLEKARNVLKTKDFYCALKEWHLVVVSAASVDDHHMSAKSLHTAGNHTALVRPRSFSNIYHFLEGSSQIIRLATMPSLFPPVSLHPRDSLLDRARGGGRPGRPLLLEVARLHGVRVPGLVRAIRTTGHSLQLRRHPPAPQTLLRPLPRRTAQLGLCRRRRLHSAAASGGPGARGGVPAGGRGAGEEGGGREVEAGAGEPREQAPHPERARAAGGAAGGVRGHSGRGAGA